VNIVSRFGTSSELSRIQVIFVVDGWPSARAVIT
jgi:hypothetical protein